MLPVKVQDELRTIVEENGFFTEPEDLASYSRADSRRLYMVQVERLPEAAG